ncbi:expressed unknown protein [Ectocarpus siliculosus]|uniref:Uncharacterized protein n=1 Tax=Ectocarpus siliculosus TaxID=2880 RepID=D8LF82_ECTSI|nr:expressed unknown protein [Ectocarpus siliculosus]|eukprot:CBN78807.1 expressed unknown protein [Ectocarpus siliculosus]
MRLVAPAYQATLRGKQLVQARGHFFCRPHQKLAGGAGEARNTTALAPQKDIQHPLRRRPGGSVGRAEVPARHHQLLAAHRYLVLLSRVESSRERKKKRVRELRS